MELKEKVEELVKRVKTDPNFAASFSGDPVKAVESVLGIDLPDDQIKALIDGVKAKVSLQQAGGLFRSVQDIFR